MTPADRLELLALAPRYAAAVDARDVVAATALFTPDGVLVTPEPPQRMGATVEHRGHDAVAAALTLVTSVDRTVHEVVGQVVEPDPADADRASGHVRCVAHHVTGEQDVVWHLRYADAYARRPGGWRLTRRELHVDLVEVRRVRTQPRLQEDPA